MGCRRASGKKAPGAPFFRAVIRLTGLPQQAGEVAWKKTAGGSLLEWRAVSAMPIKFGASAANLAPPLLSCFPLFRRFWPGGGKNPKETLQYQAVPAWKDGPKPACPNFQRGNLPVWGLILQGFPVFWISKIPRGGATLGNPKLGNFGRRQNWQNRLFRDEISKCPWESSAGKIGVRDNVLARA